MMTAMAGTPTQAGRIHAIRLSDEAPGLPFHAAYVPVSDARSELHTHQDFAEILYVVSGRGRHRLDGREAELREGDLVFVRQSDRHAFAAQREPALAFINIAFPAGMWHSFLTLSGLDPLLDRLRGPEPPTIHLARPDRERARSAFDRALRRFGDRPTAFDLVRFWTETLPLLGYDGTTEATAPPWLGRMCTAMQREENLRAGLPRMLALAAVSHGYLARCMQEHFGMTPTEFLTDRRIRHAATLLRATPVPIADIAQRCGFSSQSYFSRRFRHVEGMSPREFRERARRVTVPR